MHAPKQKSNRISCKLERFAKLARQDEHRAWLRGVVCEMFGQEIYDSLKLSDVERLLRCRWERTIAKTVERILTDREKADLFAEFEDFTRNL